MLNELPTILLKLAPIDMRMIVIQSTVMLNSIFILEKNAHVKILTYVVAA